MTSKDARTGGAAELRRRAEKVAGRVAELPEQQETLSPEETRQTLHELRVRQVQLEMQNEELRRAQEELDATRARYYDLYDLAPVGYCSVSEEGLILEANLTATTLLGSNRRALAKQLLTRFIVKSDHDIYYQHRKQLLATGERQAFDLRMVQKDGTLFSAHVETTVAPDAGGANVLRVVLSDITDRKQTEMKLQYLSMHDAMTGLYNRAYFDESMERLERGRQFPISILMADVDDLKIMNDCRGHAAGDELLTSAAHLLTASFRAEDVIARLGGDEFAVLMPGTSAEAAEGALRRFRHIVEEHNAAAGETPVHLSCGIGTAEIRTSLNEALHRADAKLYLEKEERKVASPPDHPAEDGVLSPGTEDDLRRQAEELVGRAAAHLPDDLEVLEPDKLRHTLHELHVHQIELEMQNEELRRAQVDLEAERVRYFELYDLAPVGYVTFGEDGLLLEANLTAVALLGAAREALTQKQCIQFVVREDHDLFYLRCKKLFATGERQVFELRMAGEARAPFWARLQAAAVQGEGGTRVCHLALSDISERRAAEENLGRRVAELESLRIVDQAMLASVDLHSTLSILLDQVMTKLQVDAAAVLLNQPQLNTLEYAAGRGFRTRRVEDLRIGLGEGVSGRAALERRTIQLSDPSAVQGDAQVGALWASEGFVAYVGVPLVVQDETKGVLEVYKRTPFSADEAGLEFLNNLADQAAIAIANAQLFDGLQRANMDLGLAYNATIAGWSRAMDLRDAVTAGHTQRVTEMTVRLARILGVNETELVHIWRGALLHDIGKLGVPDSVLLKPGGLTEEEWVLIGQHPQLAYGMLSPIAFLRAALDIPYCHHEKWDGTGYPRHLVGEQIPLAARLFAVVDVWDALTSDRPYRPAWSREEAMKYIIEQSGRHFDAQVVQAFLGSFDFCVAEDAGVKV